MQSNKQTKTTFTILYLLGISHMFNDILQSVIPAIYPILKNSLVLNFTQIGLITLVFQLSSSLLQPFIGLITDNRPQPYSLPVGMAFSMSGILLLSFATDLSHVLFAVFLTGLGSSIFHPEASRLAYLGSGGKRGLAQSIFQVGGNFGTSLGPIIALWIITPYGQKNISWLTIIALLAIGVMFYISKWYKANLNKLPSTRSKSSNINVEKSPIKSKRKIIFYLSILLILIFSKYIYISSLSSYYMFYLIQKFGVSTENAQLYLFIFLFSSALGTVIGGPLGDKIGRKSVIWVSILGTAPFSLIMPHMELFWTCIFSIFIGFILSSAFSAIVVYAQELLPGRIGLIGGLFFGLAFGVAGISSAILGKVADHQGLQYVYNICSFFPLIGLIAILLPDINKIKKEGSLKK